MSAIDRHHAPRLTIRRGMDVYDTDQTEYIGSVIEVVAGESPVSGGDQKSADVSSNGHVFGEELGPFPTISLGNTGPASQSKARQYGTRNHDLYQSVTGVVVRTGRRNPLARPLYIPFDAIRSMSMDRLILDVRKSDMPVDWRNPKALERH